jgi:hypothetical protein
MANIKVFDDVGTFGAEAAALLEGRERASVLLVGLDILHGSPMPLEAAKLEVDSERLDLYAVSGDYLLASDPIAMLLGMAPTPPEGEHPLDAAIAAFSFPEDGIAVVYAGMTEWQSGLALSQKLCAHLPSGKVFLLACNCAKDRKLAEAEKLPNATGIVFTDECGGRESLRTIALAFAAAGR